MAVVLAVAGLVACNPDPTNGVRPPPAGQGPAWASSHRSATRADVSRSWRDGCPVSWQDLSVVTVAYWGYDGARHTGQLVVHDTLAISIRTVFRDLYANRFQIQRIEPVDVYGGDDDASMAANNTSAFNCRRVAGTTTWSEHAYGRAIDVNPIQNPYVQGSTVDPPAGKDWLDRTSPTPGMFVAADANQTAFARQGWRWGGYWSTKKDYQHFSTTGR